MGVITTIDGVPLYSTIEEALAWAKKNKLEGAHAHRSNSTLGYMGGSSHSTATQAIAPITFTQATTSTTTPPPSQDKKVWENIDGKCYCHGTLMGNAGCHGANCRTCCYNLGKITSGDPDQLSQVPITPLVLPVTTTGEDEDIPLTTITTPPTSGGGGY